MTDLNQKKKIKLKDLKQDQFFSETEKESCEETANNEKNSTQEKELTT